MSRSSDPRRASVCERMVTGGLPNCSYRCLKKMPDASIAVNRSQLQRSSSTARVIPSRMKSEINARKMAALEV